MIDNNENKHLQPIHPVGDVLSDIAHETHIEFDPKTESGKKFKENFLNWFYRNFRYVFVIVLVLSVSIFAYTKINHLHLTIERIKETNSSLNNEYDLLVLENKSILESSKKKDIQIKTLKDKIVDNSFVIVNKDTLMNDMERRFPKISKKVAKVIVDTVIDESKKYNINPVILYSLGIVESSHRYWIEHSKVTINIMDSTGKKEKVETRAVGWGGVIWEWHHELLKEKGIADARSDLFYPDVNIKATAAIYNKFYNMDLKKGVKNRDVSAQRRYFGGNYKVYSDKINQQVVEVVNTEIYRQDTEGENVK